VSNGVVRLNASGVIYLFIDTIQHEHMPRVGYLIAFIKRLPHNKNIQVKKNALVQLS